MPIFVRKGQSPAFRSRSECDSLNALSDVEQTFGAAVVLHAPLAAHEAVSMFKYTFSICPDSVQTVISCQPSPKKAHEPRAERPANIIRIAMADIQSEADPQTAQAN
jgi:hypothetical protein